MDQLVFSLAPLLLGTNRVSALSGAHVHFSGSRALMTFMCTNVCTSALTTCTGCTCTNDVH